jgi:hypothetical protein
MSHTHKWLTSLLIVLICLLSIVVTAACSGTQDIGADQKKAIIAQATAYQTEGNVYKADAYQVMKLKKGDIIYGMLPGQSAFYADKATVEAGKSSYKALYALMQIRPHPVYGYRTKLGKYEVLEDIYVASGKILANKEITIDGKTEFLGDGGGFQYLVFDFATKLKLLEETDLHE